MNLAAIFRSLFKVSFVWYLILQTLILPAPLRSQSQDEVHVVPRRLDSSSAETAAPAGNAGLKADAQLKPLRAAADLVLVPVAVTDALNRPVLDLQRDNFRVYENKEQQRIQFFSKEDAPISVGLILDFSKSMRNKFDVERAAVTEFFNNANPQDDYFAIAFSDRPRLIADSTQSITELQETLAATHPSGATSLLDAIYFGVAKLRSARYRRRALLIITDGGDNHSHYSLRETKELAREADVMMYSIGIFDDMPVPVFKSIEEKLGKRVLTEITEVTGGRTIAADDRDKVPEIAATVSRELREQYVLAYHSNRAAHDGKWRKIRVQVIASLGSQPLHVHHKTGYIAPGE